MRKIAVFTGTRAEYGLLYWILKGLQESQKTELQLFVGGMHLSRDFGNTVNKIESDGFVITERLEFLLSSDSPVGISKSIGLAIMAASEAIERQKPDLLVVLGDRFEALAIAQAALVSCVPIAHIHGGETTEGLIDEAVRHSITKMSHLHFASVEEYRQRIIQLGENPNCVFNFGAPGIDSIVQLELLDKQELSKQIEFDIDSPYFMITHHPVTLDKDGAYESLKNLLTVLDEYEEHKLVITYPNADTHGRLLIEILDEYQHKHSDRVLLVKSLGQLRYLSLLKYCDAVIGNSSSGLIEAPTFNIPTVNIGIRQKGRLAGPSVLNADENKESIRGAILIAVSKEFREQISECINPYGSGDSSRKIVDTITSFPLQGIIYKSFYDLET